MKESETEEINKLEQNSHQPFLTSVLNAWKGVIAMVRDERNFRIEIAGAVISFALAGFFNFPLWKWTTIILTISLVLTAEAINSAVESLVDLIHPETHPLAGRVKDMAAGAVLIAFLISVIIGVLLYGPPLYQLLSTH
ncbi:MAG: diacylglycerol kinase family protein [Planctomycetaceae bacterium]|nr:diacylglycerol kinase family protein [Planctomycetaceae bacterium]